MNDSEANRRSLRFASGVGIAKTNKLLNKTSKGKNVEPNKYYLSGPIITHVHKGVAPEVYDAALQSPLCKRAIAKANGIAQQKFTATQSAGAARRAALQSLEVTRRSIVDHARSRTARALTTVAKDPNVLVFSIRTKSDGKLRKILRWTRPAPAPRSARRRSNVNVIAARDPAAGHRHVAARQHAAELQKAAAAIAARDPGIIALRKELAALKRDALPRSDHCGA